MKWRQILCYLGQQQIQISDLVKEYQNLACSQIIDIIQLCEFNN
jgi:hypothetical protein